MGNQLVQFMKPLPVAKTVSEEERHLSECPVCLEVYVDPKVLPCDHSLCAGCMKQLKQGSRIKCPLCEAVHDVSRVRPDFRLHQFLDALTEAKQKMERPGTNTGEGCFTFLFYSQSVLPVQPCVQGETCFHNVLLAMYLSSVFEAISQ